MEAPCPRRRSPPCHWHVVGVFNRDLGHDFKVSFSLASTDTRWAWSAFLVSGGGVRDVASVLHICWKEMWETSQHACQSQLGTPACQPELRERFQMKLSPVTTNQDARNSDEGARATWLSSSSGMFHSRTWDVEQEHQAPDPFSCFITADSPQKHAQDRDTPVRSSSWSRLNPRVPAVSSK